MPAGSPTYPTTIDTDATLGPTNTLVPNSTTLAAGDQIGITKNLVNQIIALETKTGINNSTDPNSLDYKTRAVATAVLEAPLDGQLYGRQSATWVVPPARNFARYIRQRHCDSPLGADDVQAGAGGAAVITGIDASLAGLGHVGIWKPTTGTANSSYMALLSSAIGAEFGLSNANKLAFRLVLKTLSPLPSGAVGATTYAEFVFGWTNTLHALPLATQRLIIWRFALNTSANWIFNTSDGTTMNTVVSTVPVNPNTWYDARIYWDVNGVIGKIGPYGGTLYSTGLVTANIPSTSMFWEIMPMSGPSGTTSYGFYTALYEIVAEATGAPMLLGDQLITNF